MATRKTPVERDAGRKAGTLRRFVHFRVTGAQTTGTNKFSFVMPEAGTYVTTQGRLNTAPTGATTFKLDVNKDGTSLYTTQTRRPTWTASSTDSAETATADITALAAGDRITIDIDDIGSTVAGSDLDGVFVYDA